MAASGFSDGGDEVEDLNTKELIKFYTVTLYRRIAKTVEEVFVNATLICCLCLCLKKEVSNKRAKVDFSNWHTGATHLHTQVSNTNFGDLKEKVRNFGK